MIFIIIAKGTAMAVGRAHRVCNAFDFKKQLPRPRPSAPFPTVYQTWKSMHPLLRYNLFKYSAFGLIEEGQQNQCKMC